MKLEDLVAKGLTEEQAKTVLDLHKKSLDGNYVPKDVFNAEREKLKTANDTIADRDKQIVELGKFKGTAEELEKKVNDLTTANAQAKADYEDKLKKMETDTAIKTAIVGQVHSVEDILPRLDATKLTITDGKVVAGLAEQLDAIKKTHPHYFKEGGNQGGNNIPGGWNPFGRSPGEGNNQGGSEAAAEFGKSLAKAASQGIASTNKAADIYFK